MKKVVVFMHISLDGYAAGPNGEMDWIKVDNALFDYAGMRTRESDVAVYGRVTYELMEGYWPTAADQPNPTKHDLEHSEWYNKVQKVIVSRTMKDEKLPHTTIISDQLSENIKTLKMGAGKDIILFGSPSIVRALMADNLIDDYWLFLNPMILGKGIKIFDNLSNPLPLQLVTSEQLASGVICLHYEGNSNK